MAKINITHPVVSVSWLHDHLETENLVVLDGTINKVFDASQSQIPHTRLFDIKNKFSDTSAPFPSTFPSEAQFQESARALGINKDSAIVVYDDKGIYSSARVWWLFKAFGYNNVAVLNGGFPEWNKAGYSTESMKPYVGASGNFEASHKPELMRFFNDMKLVSETKSHTIIDARSEGRFKSLEAEPREGLRMGTIPNSVNLPFEDLLVDKQLIANEAIASKFKNLADKETPIVFSCGSGITACVLALGATISGYENIAVYDGSWTEWGSLVLE
ncbi:sulfurtransferase [Mariniflexile sp. AS56]|uniref:sulfurtransferase n=1 Tax=Mariniflexile sp. AS56 TaxID=3063957 RepID=UPI0026F13859|nr:sulfurtransferase [Mariniflexile sp. AS56]MDO7171268.1 sulfurtransferase [Mariniflexile sp. AS56]